MQDLVFVAFSALGLCHPMLNQLHDEIGKVFIFYETIVVLGTHLGVNGSKDSLTGMNCGFIDG